jgi:membrane-associated PAP2 superfamily phosphatase
MRGGLIIGGALLAIAALTRFPGVDIWLSDRAYDFSLGTWAIDHSSSMWRPVLYEGPKALIIAFALALIAIVIRPTWLKRLRLSRREAIFLLLGLALVPATVGLVRDHSGVACPRALQRYGGEVENDFGHIDSMQFMQDDRPGDCWPSGHASGGFALLGLAFLNRSKRTRVQFAVLSLSVGGAMGFYQVLHGAHFASHIAITLLLALALIQAIRLVMPERSIERSGFRYDSAPAP